MTDPVRGSAASTVEVSVTFIGFVVGDLSYLAGLADDRLSDLQRTRFRQTIDRLVELVPDA